MATATLVRMVEPSSDQQRREMAKSVAKALHAILEASRVPENVRLESVLLLTKALFMATVKPEHRIGLFNTVVQKMRKELQEHIKTGDVK